MKSSRYAQLAYVDPFLTEQESEHPVTLGGCGCGCGGKGGCTGGKVQAVGHMGVGGNWYFYPEGERHMYGLGGFMDKHLFTIPLVNVNIDVKRAVVGVGLLAATVYALKA